MKTKSERNEEQSGWCGRIRVLYLSGEGGAERRGGTKVNCTFRKSSHTSFDSANAISWWQLPPNTHKKLINSLIAPRPSLSQHHILTLHMRVCGDIRSHHPFGVSARLLWTSYYFHPTVITIATYIQTYVHTHHHHQMNHHPPFLLSLISILSMSSSSFISWMDAKSKDQKRANKPLSGVSMICILFHSLHMSPFQLHTNTHTHTHMHTLFLVNLNIPLSLV